MGYGEAPSPAAVWPIYVGNEPDIPDDVMTVFKTSFTHQGRVHPSGEVQGRDGIQIRIRSADYATGDAKAMEIMIGLDEDLYQGVVTLKSNQYQIHSWSRSGGGLIRLGKQVPNTKRELFTINGTVLIRQLS